MKVIGENYTAAWVCLGGRTLEKQAIRCSRTLLRIFDRSKPGKAVKKDHEEPAFLMFVWMRW